jgi:predicted Zn finger-like uncharacterized protein
MIVQCPNCSTKFKFPDEKVKPGVKVRCSKCKNVFELKLDEQAATAPAPAPAPAPAAPPPPAPSQPPPPPAAAPAEPEGNFNFGEDFDFGEEKAASASTERKPAPAVQKDLDVGFGDFDVGEKKKAPEPKAPPKPQVKEEAKEESEEFSFEDEADFGNEDFGGQAKPAPAAEKEMDLGFSSEMPNIPGPSKAEKKPKEPDENSFEDNIGDFKIDRGEEIPAKQERKSSTEDFDFGGKLESYARTETTKSKPAGSDDLEAQLDVEAESPPPGMTAAATAQVHDLRRPAPTQAAPRTYTEEKSGGGLKKFLLVILILIVLSPLAFLAYLNSTGSFTFKDLSKKDFGKLKTAPEIQKIMVMLGLRQAEIKGSIAMEKDSLKVINIDRRDGSAALAVEGRIINNYPVSVSYVQVQVDLYDAGKNLLSSGTSYCDVDFSKGEMESMSEADLEGYMETQAGRNMNNMDIKPGETRDFAVIFFKPPKGIETFDPKVVNNYKVNKPGE